MKSEQSEYSSTSLPPYTIQRQVGSLQYFLVLILFLLFYMCKSLAHNASNYVEDNATGISI